MFLRPLASSAGSRVECGGSQVIRWDHAVCAAVCAAHLLCARWDTECDLI